MYHVNNVPLSAFLTFSAADILNEIKKKDFKNFF